MSVVITLKFQGDVAKFREGGQILRVCRDHSARTVAIGALPSALIGGFLREVSEIKAVRAPRPTSQVRPRSRLFAAGGPAW